MRKLCERCEERYAEPGEINCEPCQEVIDDERRARLDQRTREANTPKCRKGDGEPVYADGLCWIDYTYGH